MENNRADVADAAGDKLTSHLTMAGHLCSDINQGALSAVLPFLVVARGFSYEAVAMLVFAANLASAVIQPLFGWIGDRKPCPWFMALGIFLAGLGMCGIGFFEDYWAIVSSAVLSGIGVAMFHPEGGRLANLAATGTKAGGMSIFAVGGNIGFFVGPILTAVFLTTFGLHGTLVFLFPAVVCAAVLLCFNRRFTALGTDVKAAAADGLSHEHWGKFALVMGVLSARSIVEYGLLAFIPLFLLGVLGQPEALSSLTLSAFSIAGAFSTVLSGRASGRFGAHRLMVACFAACAALIVAFALNASVPVAIGLAMLLAVFSDLFYPSTVALGMGYVPRHLGTASGLSYGVAIAVGGIAEPFLGMAGDTVGLVPVMLALAAVAAAGALLGAVVWRADGRDTDA